MSARRIKRKKRVKKKEKIGLEEAIQIMTRPHAMMEFNCTKHGLQDFENLCPCFNEGALIKNQVG